MTKFQINDPSAESEWRALILFGKNSATYKFAFAKSLLEFIEEGRNSISLEDLSVPFAKSMLSHIQKNERQGTNSSSKFLDACRQNLEDSISFEELTKMTEKYGFNNVVDAFQNLNGGTIEDKFYHKDYSRGNKRIILTDKLLGLKESEHYLNFNDEVEARWDLVETAWNLNLSPNLINVQYDEDKKLLFLENDLMRRVDVSSARSSLSGYQKGRCFYSERVISLSIPTLLPDVDHFFPHFLKQNLGKEGINVNGVWNLVLADSDVNRNLKRAKVPDVQNINKLFERNEYYISSKHPLAETIINQTGKSTIQRESFFRKVIKVVTDSGNKPNWRFIE